MLLLLVLLVIIIDNKTMKEFDTKASLEFDVATHKTQLELYLDENRFERNLDMDVLSFWKKKKSMLISRVRFYDSWYFEHLILRFYRRF